MPYLRRQSLAGQGSLAFSFFDHASHSRYFAKRKMSSKSPSQLWRPGTGIRFTPKWPANQLYPDLGPAKPVSSPRSMGTTGIPPMPPTQSRKAIDDATSANTQGSSKTVSPITNPIVQQKPHPPSRPSNSSSSTWTFLAPGKIPETKLDFKLSETRYEAARKLAFNAPGSYWSHTLYEKTDEDGSVQKVKVHYCTSKHTMENVCKRYFENESVLGFDMEWMSYANRSSGPRQNVSLIQIASPSRIALFHIALFSKDDFVAPTFQKLMEDPKVSKVGVNILADATRLRKVLGVNMAGVFEVSHLYNLIHYCRARRPGSVPKTAVSMGKQVKDCLGLPIYKEETVRSGNWMLPLSSHQLQYAASDAYAGLQLYHILEQHRLQLDPQPSPPHFAELRRPITRPLLELDDSSVEEDFIDDSITDEDMMALEETMIADDLLPSRASSADKTSGPPARDSRLSAADVLVEDFKAMASKRKARSAALRAYYVWHNNKDLNPAAVASLLRDPPLQTNTVVTYILDVVTAEKLPFSKRRLAIEVLSLVHPSAVEGRYHTLAQDCGFTPST